MGGHEIRPNHMKVKEHSSDKMRNAEVRILPPQPDSLGSLFPKPRPMQLIRFGRGLFELVDLI